LVSPVSTLPSITSTLTFTPPAYTSTTFSYLSPALTITSTSTFYSTVQLSYVTPSQSSAGIMGPSGWNSTSSALAIPTLAPSSTDVVETLTATYFWGTGNLTTSTATTLITTTITHFVEHQSTSSFPGSYHGLRTGVDREYNIVYLGLNIIPCCQLIRSSISRTGLLVVWPSRHQPECDIDEHVKRPNYWRYACHELADGAYE
ncbi:hypothetical protein LTR53_017776, partial [Teratosphaeriaceae sp. CCFEE 6253]